ncbi:unnamed protein product [Lymnaea stagnalis]|uniref:ubiquitinyl hydrolase 1 n=1 Tax=Lymnaea stagnalis TaxID=6523 RepID=A0AAV2I0G6_LYMST
MANEYTSSLKSCKGLSFINWDELSEEEFMKLDKIINATQVSSGVQFPFPSDCDKASEKIQHVPVFQPAIPPPSIVGFSIPVHHWAQGDPNLVHSPGPHYPIAVQGPYMFSNSPLAVTDGSMTFVPALNTGQPLYAIPAVTGHPMPAHYPTGPPPQSEPVDLSVPVTCQGGVASSLPQLTNSGNVLLTHSPTHPVIITQMNVSIAADAPHRVSSASMSNTGISHPHATQVLYIAQQNLLPTHINSNPLEHTHTDSLPGIVAEPRPVKRTSSIEFGGPVVFSSHFELNQAEQNNNKAFIQHQTAKNEVVIDMEQLDLSNGSVGQEQEVVETPDQGIGSNSSYSSSPPAAVHSLLSDPLAFTESSSHSHINCQQESQANDRSPESSVFNRQLELDTKHTPVQPIKMWSSLFGDKKRNGTVNNADISRSLENTGIPNVIIKDEVKSIRYWQEKEKSEAKMVSFPTEKVVSVGPQNDPLAPKILEHLHSLSIVHTPIVIQPRGLVNGSNICFMNATLQVLMGCPPFIHLFRAFKDLPSRPGSYSSTPIFDSLVLFVNSFQNGQRVRSHGSRGKKGSSVDINLGQPFAPTPLVNVAQNILGLHIGVQHDAEEFLSQILMICHEELENVMKLTHVDGLNNNDMEQTKNGYVDNSCEDVEDDNVDDDESWQKVGPKNHHVETNVNDCGQTPLSSIFAGLSRSCLVRESGKTSDTLDSFFTLKLDIQAENVYTVKDALLRLNSTEMVHDAEGGKIQGQRRMFFDTLPPVLIMHLKLFQYSNGNGQKIQKKIEFDVDLTIPKETLSRVGKTKYLSHKSRSYKLFGVVNHHGMKMNDGHYTSDVYLPAASGWLRFDDSEVLPIQETQVLQYSERRMPYLLFYRRMDL